MKSKYNKFMEEKLTYIGIQKFIVLQQPISWGNIVDILSEKYKIEETEEKIILEVKENDENA